MHSQQIKKAPHNDFSPLQTQYNLFYFKIFNEQNI